MSDADVDGRDAEWIPHGFILSESALYAFQCQQVYPDIISFAAAIPNHLKPLFLIPIQIERTASPVPLLASRIASMRYADGAIPTGDTEEADLFGTKTFTYDDNEPTVPNSDPGSIFEIDGADSMTHHQDTNLDVNIQVPTETTFMEDVDTTQYQEYPYRSEEKSVRHSSEHVLLVRLALRADEIEPNVPSKIEENARSCSVKFLSFDERSRVYTFSVDCGNVPRTVRASLSDVDQVALNCNCPFWRYNGPEFNAKNNKFLLEPQHGTAAPAEVRDPDQKYWLCKHSYAVLRRLDSFVKDVQEENWDLDDNELLKAVDKDWDRLEGISQIPLETVEEETQESPETEDTEEEETEEPAEPEEEETEESAEPDSAPSGEQDDENQEDEPEGDDDAKESDEDSEAEVDEAEEESGEDEEEEPEEDEEEPEEVNPKPKK